MGLGLGLGGQDLGLELDNLFINEIREARVSKQFETSMKASEGIIGIMSIFRPALISEARHPCQDLAGLIVHIH